MKIRSILAMTVVMSSFATSFLSSCTSMEDEGTGYPLKLKATIETTGGVTENALTKESPCHVVAYSREKVCSSFYFLFEANAYLSGDGGLQWTGKYRYWPGVYTKFIAYWPADANVVLNDSGDVISADCSLIAISEPYCHFTENPVLHFQPYTEAGR